MTDEKLEQIKQFFNNYDVNNPKDKFIFDFIEELLNKVKKVEGYKDEEIKEYIHHAIEILNQDRYGRYDKNKKQRDKSIPNHDNMDIVYKDESTDTSKKSNRHH